MLLFKHAQGVLYAPALQHSSLLRAAAWQAPGATPVAVVSTTCYSGVPGGAAAGEQCLGMRLDGQCTAGDHDKPPGGAQALVKS
jgi:hypothetical protein